MSGFFRFQCSIFMDNLVLADAISNTWHFDSDQSFDDDADDVINRLSTFYNAIDSSVFPDRVDPNVHVKAYDLADPEPRPPRIETSFSIAPGASTAPVPNEVAICLSMKSNPVAGVPAGRLRGRIFLGPCQTGCFETAGSSIRVNSATRTTIKDAAVALAVGPDAGDARLAVYSRTIDQGGGSLDDAFHDVHEVWVDNAPDTIRSRGAATTARTTGIIAP